MPPRPNLKSPHRTRIVPAILLSASLVLLPSIGLTEIIKNIKLKSNIDLAFSDNIFRLDDDQQTRLEAGDERDIQSHRFKDMDFLSDFIISPSLALAFTTPGLFNHRIKYKLTSEYHIYLNNGKAGHPEAALELRQAVGKKGRLYFKGTLVHGLFWKNYLAGANDLNGNGNISRAERMYSAAIFDEYEAIISYRYKLTKGRNPQHKGPAIPGLALTPLAGIRFRGYNSTFENRDRNVFLAGISLDLRLSSKLDVAAAYRYENVACPNEKETLLIDETFSGFNQDLNGDNDQEEEAALLTPVDYSRRQHIIDLEAAYAFSPEWRAVMGYRLRRLQYNSTHPFDIDHYQISQVRHKARAGLEWRPSKRWSTRLEYERVDDPEYVQNNLLLKLQIRLF